jgi:hypothetical protein
VSGLAVRMKSKDAFRPQSGAVTRFPTARAPRFKVNAQALAPLLEALGIVIIPTNQTRRANATVAKGTLQRILDQYGERHLTLLLRTVVETEGNARALIDPVLCAISAVMLAYPAWPETGLRWLEAFDGIDLLELHNIARPLKPAEPARSTIAGMLVARLYPIFILPKVKPPKKVYVPKRPPDGARRAIEQGLFLLDHKGPHANSPISQVGCDKFGLSAAECAQVINAARIYGERPDLVARLSRDALFTLSAPSTSASTRLEIERRLQAGERVTAKEMVRGTR